MNCATAAEMTRSKTTPDFSRGFEMQLPAKGKEVLCGIVTGQLQILVSMRQHSGESEVPNLSDWRAALNSAYIHTKGLLDAWRVKSAQTPPADHKRLNAEIAKETRAAAAEYQRIGRQLDEIAAASSDEQGKRLEALHRNVVQHQRQQMGKVRATVIGTPNWEAASSLTLAPSEKLALQMGEAYERGRFQPVPRSPFPTATIKGRDDPEDFARDVLMYAELVANQRPNAEPSEAEQRQLREIAERLGDPRSAAGPRTAQLLTAILATWLRSRRDDNSVTVTVYQLAEMLRYEQHKSGGYRARDLDEIREYWATISMTRLSSPDGRRQGPLMAVNEYGSDELGKEPHQGQELLTPADLIKMTASARWTHLRVTPHEAFIRLAGSKMVMGRDDELNRLHPVNERADLLLGKRLEVDFRVNWNRGRGRLIRRVEELLDAAGLPTDKPRIATLRRLETALGKLEESHGTLREWRDLDGRFSEMLETVGVADTLGYSQRMTEARWRSALESRIELEAGAAYANHYRNFGLTDQKTKGGTLAGELQQYLATSGRSQAVVAEELGVSRQYLSTVLSGKRPISPAMEKRISDLLQRASTLPLPLE